MNILARKPNRREAISYLGIAGIFVSFTLAVVANLAVLAPTAEATPGCADEWFLVQLAQADLQAAYTTMTESQTAWYMCEYNTPGSCGDELFLVQLAAADLTAAQWTLSEAEADALACEYGY